MSKLLFKVWNYTRVKKTFLVMEESHDIYEKLITEASAKLEIDGTYLVLESDGTSVDCSEVVLLVKSETLILLAKDEKWIPKNLETNSDSTESILSRSSSSLGLQDMPLYTDDSETTSDSPSSICSNENTWYQMNIPWEQFSTNTLKECENGLISKQTFTDIVHVVVRQMREISTYLTSNSIKIISKRICDTYPAFKDMDDDGIVIGIGTHTLFSKIQDRNNYLNRPHKTNSLISSLKIPPKKLKIMSNSRAGCVNWQPNTENSPEDLQEMKNKLKEGSWETEECMYALLNNTLPLQRLYLNNPMPPTLIDIQNDWPILLEQNVIKWHYEKIMGHDVKLLTETLTSKTKKFFIISKIKRSKCCF